MPDQRLTSERPSLDPRVKVVGGIAAVAALYALVQHTSIAPFPHGADGLIGGFAVGAAIAAIIGWFGTRR